MKFGPVPLDKAVGKILGHNVAGADGRRILRKGKALAPEDIGRLRELGRENVYVAEMEAGDIDENDASVRIATAVMGDGLRMSRPATGRVNLFAMAAGVLRVDPSRLDHLNSQEGITLATLATETAVPEAKMVATVKILPYGLPEANVEVIEATAAKGGPFIKVDAVSAHVVGLILSGAPSVRDRIVNGFENALRRRLRALGSDIVQVDFVPLEDEEGEDELAETIRHHIGSGLDLVILAGETAIMDRHDIAPRAVEKAGGEVTCYGAPVDPGNLLMLAYLDEVPIMGAPGCARSAKTNIVDLVLPRLLAGDRLDRVDIIRMGHGGLLEDVPERPMPRSRLT
jgi:molybdenum cofactor cytidylyltransferase